MSENNINSHIVYKELKRVRKNLFIWSAIVVGFTFMVLSIYPYMSSMGDDLTALMSSVPEQLQKAMGMDMATWSSILGFYSTYFGIYIVVLSGIFTMSLGATILSKEEKDGTAEFLLVRPVSRRSIYNSKLLTLIIASLAIFLFQTIAAITGLVAFAQASFSWNTFFIMQAHGLVLIMFFALIGICISMFLNPKMNFMGLVFGCVFGSYFIDALSKAADEISWLGYISPFHYLSFSPSDPSFGLDIINALLILIIGFLLAMFGRKKFIKKDMEV